MSIPVKRDLLKAAALGYAPQTLRYRISRSSLILPIRTGMIALCSAKVAF
jgi:hypothetical protein